MAATEVPVARARNSQLRLLRQCPFAYAEQYVHEIPPAPVPALEGGRNVHAAAQLLVRRVVEGGPIDVHEIAFRAVRGGSGEYADALRVLISMQEAIGTEFTIDEKGVFLLEERLTMPLTLWDGSVVEFFGTPDLAERVAKGVCRITDWKTHHVVEPEDEFRADAQLKRYALLIHASYPAFHTFELVKRFVRYRGASHRMVLKADDLPAVQMALVSEIQTEQEVRAAGVFEATPGDWCDLCGYHQRCPVIRRYLEHGQTMAAIEDGDHAVQVAADVRALEAYVDAGKRRLKSFLGATAPGFVPLPGGGFYGFGPRAHREIDFAEAAAVLRQDGIDVPDELARIDLDVLDRLMKKLPEQTVKKLEQRTRRWQTSEFRYRKQLPERVIVPDPTPTAADAGAAGEIF